MKLKMIYPIIVIVVIVAATITTNSIQERCVKIANNTIKAEFREITEEELNELYPEVAPKTDTSKTDVVWVNEKEKEPNWVHEKDEESFYVTEKDGEIMTSLKDEVMTIKTHTNILLLLFFPFLILSLIDLFKTIKKNKKS